MAWFALCFTGGLLGSLSRLVQFLTGLRFATLAGIALPGCGLCMARSVAYVRFHYRPHVLLPVWRLPYRLWPILVLFLLAGVALWHKLGDLNFTAEEQDAVVVSSESVAIPAEDFA
ncbi:hypothetical protein V6N12_010061 [Hibiscus sabdariffa]|uniref:Uncharacterized protein n=1 Tax=Hibiscus sabdariffa TaxID=183260 RepID=A0ABR2ECK9_9ROSI